jgi:hypothetical protein
LLDQGLAAKFLKNKLEFDLLLPQWYSFPFVSERRYSAVVAQITGVEEVSMDSMFFCIPQQAYLSITTCKNLRERPIGKAPAGAPPRLIACEKCTMHPLVDRDQVPTVTLDAYLGGSKPKTANLNSPRYRKLLAEVA